MDSFLDWERKLELTAYKRCHWFNSDFHSGFLLNDDNKITEISFDVNPFQIDVNNNLKVITYIRDHNQSRPIQIKLKLPYNQSREVFNDDNEAFPIIYTNHTGVEGMNTYYPYSVARLVPQQIPRFTFRVDDNYNMVIKNSYFTSLTNGEVLQVAMGTPTEKYIIFKSSGSFILTNKMMVDILVVGGGGGGAAGGGGAGGVSYLTNQTLNAGTYEVNVGAGGLGGYTISQFGGTRGSDGEDSYIKIGTTTIAIGYRGGGGARNGENGSVTAGVTYGSTGGNGNDGSTVTNPVTGQVGGNKGGLASSFATGVAGYSSAGGGGGAGGIGGNAKAGSGADLNAGGLGGAGGIGIQYNITGVNTYYAGGGGGGTNTNATTNTNPAPPQGGLGGGGNGSWVANGVGLNGAPNTGGGGGGGDYESTGRHGNGGSGVVIIRYREERNRIEGITPEETLIQATNANIPITIDSQYKINYQPPMVLPKGTYSATFTNGNITFNSITDRSYPILKDADNLDINPIIWYKFDGASTFLNDSISSLNLTNTGTTYSTTNFLRGDGSVAFSASGTPQYLVIPNTINLATVNANTGITISFWVRLTSSTTGNGTRIIDFGEAYGASGFNWIIIYLNTAGNIQCQIRDDILSLYRDETLSAGKTSAWIHFVWSISTSGVWNIYMNNSILRNNFAGIKMPAFTSAVEYKIGRSSFSGEASLKLDGNMDDFRIYNFPLSATQVTELYNGRLAIYNPPGFILGTEIEPEA